MTATFYVAKIREETCIGCTKCLKACPIDAIFGAANQMHTVLSAECTGCELCIEPCPVNYIELIPVAQLQYDKHKARSRCKAKLVRGDFQRAGKLSLAEKQKTSSLPLKPDKKKFIAEAIARAKAKKTYDNTSGA